MKPSKDLPPAQARTSSPKPNGQPSPGSNGNTPGLIVPKPEPNGGIEAGKPTALTNPPAKIETPQEASFWGKISGAVHAGLDVLGFVPGLGAIPDLANAGLYALEGDMVNAAISTVAAVPGVGDAAKAGTMVAKGGKAIAKEVAEKAAKEKAEKELAEKTAKEKADKEAAQAGGKPRKEDGGYSKGKKKLKCGENGEYGALKKKTGEGKFDRDHIPSKAALKKRASELLNRKLKPWEEKAIDDRAMTIAIPRQAHIDVSPTYGQTAAEAAKDAQDLKGSARRDVEEMLKKIDEYDADGGCKKAYQRSARKVLRMDNKDFDKFLVETLKSAK